MNDLSECGKTLSRNEKQTTIGAINTPSDNNESISKLAVPGTIVTFNLLDHEENETDEYTLKLVAHFKKDENEISLDSPIGKNIHRACVGESKTYTINSRQFTVTILNIQPAVS